MSHAVETLLAVVIDVSKAMIASDSRDAASHENANQHNRRLIRRKGNKKNRQ